MSHLTLETLARLVDEAPDPTENGHLDICEECRSELEFLRADAAALRTLPDPRPPIAAWDALEHRLGREGLLRRTSWQTHAMRIAAALVVFVLGAVMGGTFMRPQQAQMVATTETTRTQPAPAVSQPVIIDTPLPAAVMTAAPAAGPRVETQQPLRPAATAEEAVRRLRAAEDAYLAALGRVSDFSGRAEPTDPVARLAALESIVATTRAALGQAPADAVINGYHLTAVAQRDATLRQLAASGQNWY